MDNISSHRPALPSVITPKLTDDIQHLDPFSQVMRVAEHLENSSSSDLNDGRAHLSSILQTGVAFTQAADASQLFAGSMLAESDRLDTLATHETDWRKKSQLLERADEAKELAEKAEDNYEAFQKGILASQVMAQYGSLFKSNAPLSSKYGKGEGDLISLSKVQKHLGSFTYADPKASASGGIDVYGLDEERASEEQKKDGL